jgi:hypothetical protein
MLISIDAVYGYSKSCATGDHFVGKTLIDTNPHSKALIEKE